MSMKHAAGLLAGVSAFALVGAASAQTAAPGGTVDEIVVTGSRIVANGYQAPTPVTVVSTTELLKKAPESIAAGPSCPSSSAPPALTSRAARLGPRRRATI